MESIRALLDHLGLVVAPTLEQCQEMIAQNDDMQYGMTTTQMLALATLAATVPIGIGLRKVYSLASFKEQRIEHLLEQLKKYDEELTAQKKVEYMFQRQVNQYKYDHKIISGLYKSEEKVSKAALGKIASVQLELISYKRDNTCLKFQNEILKGYNDELTSKQVSSEINAKEMEKGVLLEKIDNLTKEISHLEQTSVKKNKEIANLQDCLRCMQREAEEKESDSNVLNVKLETMKTQYEDRLAKIEKQLYKYQNLERREWSKQMEYTKIVADRDTWKTKYEDLKFSCRNSPLVKQVDLLQKELDDLKSEIATSSKKEFDVYRSMDGQLKQLQMHGENKLQEKDLFNELFINYLQINPPFSPDQIVANAIVNDVLKELSQEMQSLVDDEQVAALFEQAPLPDLVHAHGNQDHLVSELKSKVSGGCALPKANEIGDLVVDELKNSDPGRSANAHGGHEE